MVLMLNIFSYESITQADFTSFAAFWAYADGQQKQIDYSVLGKRAVQRAEAKYQRDLKNLMEVQGPS